MYIKIASVKGPESMSNDMLLEALKAQTDFFNDYTPEEIQSEKDGGFILYEHGEWVAYYEDMSK